MYKLNNNTLNNFVPRDSVKKVITRDVKFILFVKLELHLLKFELNFNFVYILDPLWQQTSLRFIPGNQNQNVRPSK